MAETKIEWATTVWNPVTGCSPVSDGCKNCYAKRMANRLRGRCGYDAYDPFRVTVHQNKFELPLTWRRPRRVFVNSMGDLFHDLVDEETLDGIFRIISYVPQHTYMILTKRPDRMRKYFENIWRVLSIDFQDPYETQKKPDYPLPNLWLGVSVENQKSADERIPELLKCPAAVRFVSCEPLLGPVGLFSRGIDWVIAGAETGPHKRHMNLDWARHLRDQCQASNVPFFFKKDSQGNHGLDGRVWEELPR